MRSTQSMQVSTSKMKDGVKTIEGTVPELTKKLKLGDRMLSEYEMYSVLKAAESMNQASRIGTQKNFEGRGKPSTVWKIHPVVVLPFSTAPKRGRPFKKS